MKPWMKYVLVFLVGANAGVVINKHMPRQRVEPSNANCNVCTASIESEAIIISCPQWMLASDKLAAAVKAGKLKGE
jgi:hypothetical protein